MSKEILEDLSGTSCAGDKDAELSAFWRRARRLAERSGAQFAVLGSLLCALSLSCRYNSRRVDTLRADLPTGGTVEFRAALVYDAGFPETRKELIWTRPDGTQQTFLIDDTHAGYDEIEIRISEDGTRLWLVDLSAVDRDHFAGALDLPTGTFYRERLGMVVVQIGPPVAWADKSGGKVLARKRFR